MDESLSATRRRNAPITYVTSPTLNDVLLGRGAPYISFEGNRRFRSYVRTRKAEYMAANRHQTKEAIARSVINEIQRRGGRFLERVKDKSVRTALGLVDDETKLWALAPDDAVVEKCKQALRDKDPAIKNQSARRKSYSGTTSATTEQEGVNSSMSDHSVASRTPLRQDLPIPAYNSSFIRPSEQITPSVDASFTVQSEASPASQHPNLLSTMSTLPTTRPIADQVLSQLLQLQQQQQQQQRQQLFHTSQMANQISQLLSLQTNAIPRIDFQQAWMLHTHLLRLQQFQPSLQVPVPQLPTQHFQFATTQQGAPSTADGSGENAALVDNNDENASSCSELSITSGCRNSSG